MRTMRSITHNVLLLALVAGCQTPQYGKEEQLTLQSRTQPIWAVAPAVNLSGEPSVDPLLQADLVYQQIQAVHNVTVVPVNRVIEVYAALRIEKVESEEQAAIVCEQLGCDALLIPTVTAFDPYNPPKVGAAVQLITRPGSVYRRNVNARELSRRATPGFDESLPPHPNFIQVVGMYDSANGSVRDAVLNYAKGRNDPVGPLGSKEYFVNMDRYCGFVYHSLIADLIREAAKREADDRADSNHPAVSQRATLTAPQG
ncbi:MAG TPA: hypothetical protein VLI90_19280 [Tepidisphaeraceae bacterium]|nr:hypothetical protein [Tepidisphaeraceae bacterium]